MSDKQPNSKEVTETVPLEPQGAEESPPLALTPEVVIDKRKNEVTLVGPNNERVTFRTKVIEEEDEEAAGYQHEPMTPEEFEAALATIDRLGLTWTADMTPNIKAKSPETEKGLVSEEFLELQDRYPGLPFEVSIATAHKLTGNKSLAEIAGGEDSLKKKAEIAERIFIDRSFRSEFFFKHAIKVPYLRDIDWEVVYKLYERGAEGMPGIPYGMLALTLQDPFFTSRGRNVRNITVAIDETIVNHLLKILGEVKVKLENARRISDVLNEQHLLEEQDHDDKEPSPQLGQ